MKPKKLMSGSRVPMNEAEAKEVTEDIRRHVHALADTFEAVATLVREAWLRRADVALGFDSWDSYAKSTFADDMHRMRKTLRGPVVSLLAGSGMPTRAIASALGIDPKTVRNDLASGGETSSPDDAGHVTGVDGKKYARRRGRSLPHAYASEVTKVERSLKQLGDAIGRLRQTAESDPDEFAAHAGELHKSLWPRLEVIHVRYLGVVRTLEFLSPPETAGDTSAADSGSADSDTDEPAADFHRGER